MDPLPGQWRMIKSDKEFIAFVGGWGSGKSYCGAHKHLQLAAINRQCDGLSVSPTYRMLRDTAIPTFIGVLNENKIEYHYKPSDEKIYLEFGNAILFRSAEKPERLMGGTYGWAGADEYINLDAWQIMQSRVRHPNAVLRQCFITTTDEEGIGGWLYEEFVDKKRAKYELINANTAENKHLPDSYLENLKDSLNPKLIERYVDGKFVSLTSGRVYFAFDRDKHIVPQQYDDRLSLYHVWDFNVDPMCSAVIQDYKGIVRIIDEIILPNSNTREVCREFISRYGGHQGELYVYGDATGRARSTAADQAVWSDYEIIAEEYNRHFPEQFESGVRMSNPLVKDRINCVNSKLFDGLNRVGMVVDPRCIELIKDFERVMFKKGSGAIDKSDPARTHISDAVGYYVADCYPVHLRRAA